MEKFIVFDAQLTPADRIVLEDLTQDIRELGSPPTAGVTVATGIKTAKEGIKARNGSAANGNAKLPYGSATSGEDPALAALDGLNDLKSADFEPTVFTSVDLRDLNLSKSMDQWLLRPYIKLASKIMRHETDVVFFTHLLIYFSTTIPSAMLLFYHFTWIHGVVHFVVNLWYMGAYTIMMHQHIHQRGFMRKELWFIDHLFPYILDPLMGHTWNSYFYHHVKHHHVEGNGPNDLSSTIRYQRDSLLHFLHYYLRFFLFAWAELPLYFLRTKRPWFATKGAFWEWSSYLLIYFMWTQVSARATLMTMFLPFLLLRAGLMLGNWGQHAFVDDLDPDSDYRSSITLVDTTSNRFCFNDGYHTSHHLNPLRHWREHPNAFLRQKATYAAEDALVFHDIDFIMISVRLLRKDYMHLARCLVPMGPAQVALSLEERAEMLRRHTRAFTDEEIARKFPRDVKK